EQALADRGDIRPTVCVTPLGDHASMMDDHNGAGSASRRIGPRLVEQVRGPTCCARLYEFPVRRGVHDGGRPQFLSCSDASTSEGNGDGVDETNAASSPIATTVTAHHECTLLRIPSAP